MLRKYYEIIRITFNEATTYRLDALTTLLSSVIFLVLYYSVWSAIAAAGTLQGGLQQVMSYIVVGQVVSNAAFLQTEMFIGERVRRGTIVNELKRPLSLLEHTYFHEVGWVFFNSLVKSLPVLVIGYLFLGLKMPNPLNAVYFLVSLLLAFNLVFFFAYSVAMLIFWTKVDWSLRMMRNTVQNLFSGVLFPLYLLPPALAGVFSALPFQSMADTPIRIFMMTATGDEALYLIGKQVFWIVILGITSQLMWRKAKKKITVQGG